MTTFPNPFRPVIPVSISPDFAGFAAANPWVGAPVGAVQSVPGGLLQEYQQASVYGRFGPAVFEVHGAIRDKYRQLGGPGGFLGLPITNETPTSDGKGRFNRFVGGVIFWHPSIGAFEVHGAILAKWTALGLDKVSYPVTDETSTPGGGGRYNHFRTFFPDGSTADDSIYWTPAIGAHEIRGAIRDAWAAGGWEQGYLGFPVSDEYDLDGGRQSDFENGSIFWNAVQGAHARPQWRRVDRPNITFPSGIAIGGHARLTLFSDGTTHFEGHLHDSGIPSYDCLAVFAVKDSAGRAYSAAFNGRARGWMDGGGGGRNLNWDQWGTSPDVRKNWAAIRAGSQGGGSVTVTSNWSMAKVADEVASAIGEFLKQIVLSFEVDGSIDTDDPAYGGGAGGSPDGEQIGGDDGE